MKQGGDGEDRGASTTGLLGSHRPLIYVWMTLITSLYTLRGMGVLEMGLWGIEGWRHRLNGAMRLVCVELLYEKHNDLNADGHSNQD